MAAYEPRPGIEDLVIVDDDPGAADVRALLAGHLAFTREQSPPEHVHALEVDGLLQPDVHFFSARSHGDLVGVGALRHLDDEHAEIKSMHTVEAARGRGVGRVMVAHLVVVAHERGYRRVSIETGTMEAFAPARALYASCGFLPCEPFGAYTVNPYSVCMTRVVDEPRSPARR
jgi:putative acetyltransferase